MKIAVDGDGTVLANDKWWTKFLTVLRDAGFKIHCVSANEDIKDLLKQAGMDNLFTRIECVAKDSDSDRTKAEEKAAYCKKHGIDAFYDNSAINCALVSDVCRSFIFLAGPEDDKDEQRLELGRFVTNRWVPLADYRATTGKHPALAAALQAGDHAATTKELKRLYKQGFHK